MMFGELLPGCESEIEVSDVGDGDRTGAGDALFRFYVSFSGEKRYL